jgi:hypothetical protein
VAEAAAEEIARATGIRWRGGCNGAEDEGGEAKLEDVHDRFLHSVWSMTGALVSPVFTEVGLRLSVGSLHQRRCRCAKHHEGDRTIFRNASGDEFPQRLLGVR